MCKSVAVQTHKVDKFKLLSFFKKNWPFPASFVDFRLYKQTLQFLIQIYVKNVYPVYSAGIWNFWPLEHEHPPITTRPGLSLQSLSELK